MYLRYLNRICNLQTTTKVAFSSKPLKVEIPYKEISSSKFQSLITQILDVDEQKRLSERINSIVNQYDYLKYLNGHVPSDITVEQMQDLLEFPDERQISGHFRYLFLTEVRKLKDEARKMNRVMRNQEYVESRGDRQFGIFDPNGNLSYQLWGNSLLTRIGSHNVAHLRVEAKLRHAALFGQNLIFDMGYDEHMSLSECRIQARHIQYTATENLTFAEPYNLYLTNCDSAGQMMKQMKTYFQHSPFRKMDLKHHVRAESFVELFPQEKLVYLSPDSPNVLTDYSHDDIFIVGAFLDKRCLHKPVSFTKAESAGIRHCRLPLDEHVLWGPGSSKNLCIMHVVAILNSVKDGHKWRESLRAHIPKRKLKSEVIIREEELQRMERLKRKLQQAQRLM